MPCNCQSCHPYTCNCTDPAPTPPICVDGEKCEEVTDAGCVEYTGSGISTFGIITNDRLDIILNKLSLNSTSQEIIVSDTSTIRLTGLVARETTFSRTVTLTTNSTTLVLNSGTDITPGQLIEGTAIDVDTRVVSITGTTLVLSKPILGSITYQVLTFTRSAGVGLASNPLIAEIKKSIRYDYGQNQLILYNDGLYVPRGTGIRTVTDNSLISNVGGITLTVVTTGVVYRDAVFDVKADPTTGSIYEVVVLDTGLYSVIPTDIIINHNLGINASLSIETVEVDSYIRISVIYIVHPGTGYFDDHYISEQVKISADNTNKLELKNSGSTGLYVSPKIKVSTDDTIPDYLINKLVAGSNITITPSVDSTYGKILTVASTGGSGSVITVVDTSTIDLNLDNTTHVLTANLILDNKNLVTPIITPGFTFNSNTGGSYTSNVSAGQGYDSTDSLNPIVDIGARVSLNSSFSWHVSDSTTQSAPTSCTGDFGTTLPTDNIGSSPSLTNLITQNTIGLVSKQVTILKPASGLNVVNNKVIIATGNESKSASISIRFKNKFYAGVSTNNNITTGSDILALANRNFSDTGSTVTLTGQITSSTQYYYFCFPTVLHNIIENGALPILGAFGSPYTISVINDAGLVVTYYVYRSNAINSFSTSSLLSFYL